MCSHPRPSTDIGSIVFNLIQALQETRELADDHPDDPEWSRLRSRIDEVIDEIDDSDPATAPNGHARVSLATVDPTHADLAAAALMAVHDRPEEEHLELARAAVEDLADDVVS